MIAASEDQAIYLDVLARTFGMSLVVTLCCLALGFPLAYLLSTLPTRSSNLLMILVLLPFWTSILVRVASWIVLLQSGGLVNQALQALGLINEPLQLVFNRFGVYISMTHILLPFMVLPLYSVMKGISPIYLRAAQSLGCPPFQSFWKVYFPQTIPGVAAGSLLVFILSMGYYITPGPAGQPEGADGQLLHRLLHQRNHQLGHGRRPLHRAAGRHPGAVRGLFPLLRAWPLGKQGPLRRIPMLQAYASPVERAWFYTHRVLCALILLFLILPILVIVPLSFNQDSFLMYPMTGFSLRWYEEIISSDVWRQSLMNSLIISPRRHPAGGDPGHPGLHRSGAGRVSGQGPAHRHPDLADGGAGGHRGGGGVSVLRPLGLAGSYTGLILAHAVLGVPFVITTVTATLQGFDYNLVRAASSLGAGPIYTFFRVTLPMVAPGIISGGLFAFATSFDEVVVTLFLASPGQTTLPRQMFAGIRENISPAIAAVATILIVLSTLMLLTLEGLRQRSERMRTSK